MTARIARLDRDSLILLTLVAAAMAGNGIIVPIMPEYGRMFSQSATWVGMLITIFGVARMLSNLPTGYATRHVPARGLMVLGHALLTLGALGSALAEGLPLLLAGRFLQGAGSGIFLTTAAALMAIRAPADRRGRVMALYQGAVFAGAGIGPMIGGLLAEHMGLRAPFWAYAAVSFAGMLLVWPMAGSDLLRRAAASSGSQRLRLTPRLRANLGMAFASGFARTAALWHSIPLVAVASYGMGFDMVGLAASATALANLAILPISGAVTDRIGSRILPPVSAALFAVSLLLIAFGGSAPAFWTGAILAGIAGGLNGPSLAAALTEISPPGLIGPGFGLQRTVADMGFVIGPLLVGAMSDLMHLAPVWGLVITAALLLVSAANWVATYRQPAQTPDP